MAERKIQIRARSEEGQVEVVMRIEHPMETGQRTDPETRQKIPAHYIQKIALEHNGKVVATLFSGPGVSKDPFLGFRLKDAKNGDKLKVSWTDSKGESGSSESTIKL
jgi:sulfur-oxidizing protein SoxZ